MPCFSGILTLRCLFESIQGKGVTPLEPPPKRSLIVVDAVLSVALFWWFIFAPSRLSPVGAVSETKKLISGSGGKHGASLPDQVLGNLDTLSLYRYMANVSLSECTQLPLRTKGGQLHPDGNRLERWAAKGYSQFGADGLIHKLFADLQTTNKFYIEFGTQDGSECNSRRLREVCGWTGLLMDGGFENAMINQHMEWITRENIVSLFTKYNVPREPDLLSVDIDGNDFHVLEEILREGTYRPRVIIVETLFSLNEHTDMVRVYNAKKAWDLSCYISASMLAYYRLARAHGYSIVGALAPDLYWVRDDVLHGKKRVPYTHTNDVPKLYNFAIYHNKSAAALLHARCVPLFQANGWQTSEEIMHRPTGAEAPVHFGIDPQPGLDAYERDVRPYLKEQQQQQAGQSHTRGNVSHEHRGRLPRRRNLR